MTKTDEKQVVVKSVWDENLKAIQQTFGKDLTPTEFTMFVEMGKSLNLNPFVREIWAVKYDNRAPSIFIGRDGYRKNAQSQSDYNGHSKEAIYENDVFEIENGRVKHKINFNNRGRLIGAYCEVYRKGIDHPFRESVKFSEYNTGFSNWKRMPETMIKKVAEAQALRMAYQSVFAGTYDESERWEEPPGGNTASKARTNQNGNKPPINIEKAEDAEVLGEKPPIMDEKTKNFLSAMSKIKSRILELSGSEKEYYQILGSHGYEHCNEITSPAIMETVYKEIQEKVKEHKASLKNNNSEGGNQNA
jgi:phage recombination protein Bet